MSESETPTDYSSRTVLGEEQTAPARRFEDLPPAAQRALREAEERRKNAKPLDLPKELNGRDGPEPVRYGDWENKGIASDF